MFTLRKLASIVGGEVIGAPDLAISGVSDIKTGAPGTITFLFNPKNKEWINKTTASAIIVSDADILNGKNGIIVNNPRLAMAQVLKLFEYNSTPYNSIHPSAIIDKSAKIGKNVNIGAFTLIGKNVEIADDTNVYNNVSIGDNVIIGNDVILHPQTAIYSHVTIGNRVIIDMGSVIGSCGYGYETENDIHFKIPQIGSVIIENDVELGANCTIDRGTINNTIIGEGTKIDNLVQIAHNVKIGKSCLILALTGIAGSAIIGDHCIIAGQVGIGDGVNVGERAIIIAKSGVTKSLPGGKIYAGMPAREVHESNKRDAAYVQIISLKNRLKKIEEKLVG